ncbi:glucose-6-phosphate isomerase [Leucobacter japonicus]|uniref:glucose-6-phosphate isomerase n=1 Tax=Leucobacter japonicus TaxID=1461259 RepID=UPI0006A7F06F|nr:glucose-6-phosphate isomerase [Leucobacter japonicus]
MTLDVRVAQFGEAAHTALAQLVADRVASRIFAHDATLWGSAAEPEASIRLGWTDITSAANDLIPRITALRDAFHESGVDRIVLCGMGGSSLAPAVITQWADVELTMIDSTAPTEVRRVLAGDLARTAVVVSSKSGSTIETRSHLAAFEDAFRVAGITPSERVVIVTDPGSPLEAESIAAGRHVFTADPTIGGRFSALTAFGLVPSGLAGVDLARLIAEEQSVRDIVASDDAENPALRLAAAIFAGLPRRFVLAVAESTSARWGLGRWIEQLVAESTGKDGLGVLPIALQADAPELSAVPQSAQVVAVTDESDAESAASFFPDVSVSGSLGGQFLLWEVATAALGRLMGIDPFNQPDVESAKVAARSALAAQPTTTAPTGTVLAELAGAILLAEPEGAHVSDAASLVSALQQAAADAGYLSLQAYADPHGDAVAPLEQLRDQLAGVLQIPVALGWGPSYLHSTGQLHKGGPANAVFLQISDASPEPFPIPGGDGGFDALITAQARGDRSVLIERGRPVFALAADDLAATVRALGAAL